MEEYFFKADFRFDKYVNERLMEISDEGERRALKEIVRETIIPFYEYSESVYHELEKNLQPSYKSMDNGFEIITGIAHKESVDMLDDAMFPMKYSDLGDGVIDVKELKAHIANEEPYKVMQLFFMLDYKTIHTLEKSKRVFRGTIKGEYEEYPAEVVIKRNTSYLKQIRELYYVFEENGVEWKTICAPYLRKFFDVYIVRASCPDEQQIMGITIDFEELNEYIVYDLIPTWNIRFLEESTSAYPKLSFDQIHYEHCIFANRIKDKCDYLVCSQEHKLWEVFRQNGDLHIICDTDEPLRWKLIEVVFDSKNRGYDMPVFGNMNGHVNKKSCIHTKAEIIKFIKELEYNNILELLAKRHIVWMNL